MKEEWSGVVWCGPRTGTGTKSDKGGGTGSGHCARLGRWLDSASISTANDVNSAWFAGLLDD